jgi:hypothetical protein
VPYSPSPALQKWRIDRAVALDSLVAVHGKVVDGKPGRQYATEHLNQALFIALASEFQGYCRDLHDIAVFAATDGLAASGDPRMVWARAALIRNRKLSVGNANSAALGNDFKFFGMNFWDSIKTMHPSKRDAWREFLDTMIETRNAIVHRDDTKLAAIAEPLTLRTFKKWRATLNSVTSGIDKVVDAYLQNTIGKSW